MVVTLSGSRKGSGEMRSGRKSGRLAPSTYSTCLRRLKRVVSTRESLRKCHAAHVSVHPYLVINVPV